MPSLSQENEADHLAPNAAGDLFDHDAGMEAFFRDLGRPAADTAVADDSGPLRSSRHQISNKSQAELGIDEEVQVKKSVRQPVPKLDEDRYVFSAAIKWIAVWDSTESSSILSAKGIPKLRKISKDRLKFKGKGHEVIVLPTSANAHSIIYVT